MRAGMEAEVGGAGMRTEMGTGMGGQDGHRGDGGRGGGAGVVAQR